MPIGRSTLFVLLLFALLSFSGCAALQGREPVDVTMVGVEPLEGEGLEVRMLVKLRIQNPNDTSLDFDGVSVEMNVQGKRFATGVSDAGGSVPRFGETVVSVPMSISAFRIARQIMGILSDEYRGNLSYDISGRLAGPAFNSMKFKSAGELTLPEGVFSGAGE